MTEINNLLNTTSAGQIAQQLDAKDGKTDGKINASIWNEFVKDKGGKEIQSSISIENAMKSITTYAVKNAKTQENMTANKLANTWQNDLKETVQPQSVNQNAEIIQRNLPTGVSIEDLKSLGITAEIVGDKVLFKKGNNPIQKDAISLEMMKSTNNSGKDTGVKVLSDIDLNEIYNEVETGINNGSIQVPNGLTKEDLINTLNLLKEQGLPPNIPDEIKNNKAALKEMLIQGISTSVTNNNNQPKRFTQVELENKVANIISKLDDVLKSKSFQTPDGKTINGSELLKYINTDKIKYNASNYGAAEAKSETGEIILNTNGEYSSTSDAELMKLLIHEALHCAFNTNMNTQTEEQLCESQAIQITQEIVNSEKGNSQTPFTDFNVYGHNISEFSDTNLLNNQIDNWLQGAYNNRPKNLNGDISIIKDFNQDVKNEQNQINIQSGDIILVNGKSIGNIGQDGFILESAKLGNSGKNSNACQLVHYTNNQPHSNGVIVFDGAKDPTDATANLQGTPVNITIMRNGQIITTGKIFIQD